MASGPHPGCGRGDSGRDIRRAGSGAGRHPVAALRRGPLGAAAGLGSGAAETLLAGGAAHAPSFDTRLCRQPPAGLAPLSGPAHLLLYHVPLRAVRPQRPEGRCPIHPAGAARLGAPAGAAHGDAAYGAVYLSPADHGGPVPAVGGAPAAGYAEPVFWRLLLRRFGGRGGPSRRRAAVLFRTHSAAGGDRCGGARLSAGPLRGCLHRHGLGESG